MSLTNLIEERAARRPEAVAVVSERGTLSYGDLNAQANRLAYALIGRGVRPGSRVGICVDRGPEAIVALLGVLKAGGACVPLDPEYPMERLLFMVRDVAASLLVTQPHLDGLLAECPVPRIFVDAPTPSDIGADHPNPRVRVGHGDLAYVMYTSGSTGLPKGVEIGWTALYDNAVKTARLLELTEVDALFQFSSLSFASSIGQIFAPLVTGARLVLRSRQYSAAQLVRYVEDTGVSVLWLTPSTIRYLTQRADASIGRLRGPLRLLRSGGESLDRPLVEQWFAQSDVPLLNVYGPTEAVQDITACLMTEPPDVVSIGRPLFDAEVFLLDDSGAPVSPGEPGELLFTTPGMALGYVNQPELTHERFVERVLDGRRLRLYRTGDNARQLPDGRLEFVGRHDRQIKIRGYRVEPAEVEQRLTAHHAVLGAVVALHTLAAGAERLVAYYVSDDDKCTARALRQWCANALPMHMVPSRYVRVAQIPLTANGKADRRALEQLG
ncbi:amino acid adenylation domain-containing protein [Micromonospora sp. DT46]|uniref:amino acid adenylation domain-containing protein n=1 Tax=Micromonospora sp. DT46 TaxID=3393435 RepID=UPI003CF9D0FF